MTAFRSLHVSCAALAFGLSVTACASVPTAGDYTERFPITVHEQRASVEIAAPAGAHMLRYDDKDALRAMASEYHARGHGPVAVILPVGAGNDEAAVRLGAQARAELADAGLTYRHILGGAYDATGQADAPVIVEFITHTAEAPDCSRASRNYGVNWLAWNGSNLGCATQANMAAMVSDPRDLAAPRAVDQPDGGRRATILDRYREGQSTATNRSDDEAATITEAVE